MQPPVHAAACAEWHPIDLSTVTARPTEQYGVCIAPNMYVRHLSMICTMVGVPKSTTCQTVVKRMRTGCEQWCVQRRRDWRGGQHDQNAYHKPAPMLPVNSGNVYVVMQLAIVYSIALPDS